MMDFFWGVLIGTVVTMAAAIVFLAFLIFVGAGGAIAGPVGFIVAAFIWCFGQGAVLKRFVERYRTSAQMD